MQATIEGWDMVIRNRLEEHCHHRPGHGTIYKQMTRDFTEGIKHPLIGYPFVTKSSDQFSQANVGLRCSVIYLILFYLKLVLITALTHLKVSQR